MTRLTIYVLCILYGETVGRSIERRAIYGTLVLVLVHSCCMADEEQARSKRQEKEATRATSNQIISQTYSVVYTYVKKCILILYNTILSLVPWACTYPVLGLLFSRFLAVVAKLLHSDR